MMTTMRRRVAGWLPIALAACRPAPLVPPPVAEDTLLDQGETLRWTFDEPQWHAGSGFAATSS